MNVSVNHAHAFPFDLHWSAQDLADAVPLRLHEIVRFDAALPDAANAAAPAPRRGLRQGYLRRGELPDFVRIR
ncbi:hypothetical protein [Vulcaniibacterium tengchongense]|uniref:Uncharacterized protein n=1 Tax=Vulcaniibacterium tengchongense TaxID=1273429 RepID=A0A3N4V3I2_9GAMM|nr:hypothetical protein [Vulcaniibacterium tengchongense]RPE75825.1 hypothetical protein EDC50_2722 [Vulcaniibacterium tengchongense]